MNYFPSTVLLIVFYPIIPTVAYLNLLWHIPKNRMTAHELSDEMVKFRSAEFKAKMAQCSSGRIESPIQFTLQVTCINSDATHAREERERRGLANPFIFVGPLPNPLKK